MDHDETITGQRNDPAQAPAEQQLTIAQTATGYWSVARGGTHVAGAMTKPAAERERDLMMRLRRRNSRRTRAQMAGV
jgi:hypothetical protein